MSAAPDPRCGRPMRSGKICGRPAGHQGQHRGIESVRAEQRAYTQKRQQGYYAIHVHGYAGYTRGCRCETCAAAKAAYMSEKRITATASARPGITVTGVTHGTRSAYKDKGCRCEKCTEFMRDTWRRWSRDARHPEAGAA